MLAVSVSAQKTQVKDTRSAGALIGRHKLSLQWVSWNYFGVATVTNRRGIYMLKGEQRGRGRDAGNYVTVDGRITSINAKEFSFRGKIVTRVDHINGGEPCVREGEYTFKITGKRRYWRLQEMDSPCDVATDYVDIYFR
jgi:hypothetical protein